MATYRNGWTAKVGDRVLSEDSFRGRVLDINSDDEATVAWAMGGIDMVLTDHLDLLAISVYGGQS